MNRPFLFVCCVLAGSLGASSSSAFCRTTTATDPSEMCGECTTEGTPLEWRRRCISYAIDARGSLTMPFDDVVDAVDASFATWMDVTCNGQPTDLEVSRTDEFSLCQEPQFNANGPNVNTVAFVSPEPDGVPVPTALAVTIVWFFADGEIVDADMLINEDLAPHTVCPDDGCAGVPGMPTAIDLQNIVTHEAGHFLGIAHTDIQEATMFCDSPRGEVQKRTLAQDDVNALCSIYPPGSISGNCDPTPRGGELLGDCTDPNNRTGDGGGGGCGACATRAGSGPGGTSMVWSTLLALALLRLHRRR